ncbi:type I polyketide synthase, partial [Streptomonospora salina]|uniref:type I polyketide synthase n=1 Tax=Streptomonospora salina TaxID=104205 RepID=UPI0035E6D941
APPAEPVRALMPALERWHRRRRERDALAGLCYREQWTPAPAPAAPPAGGRWLVVREPSGSAADTGRAWCDALAARGLAVETLEAKRSETDRASLAELLRTAAGTAEAPLDGVLCLLPADGGDAAAPAAGTALAAALLQAMGDTGLDAPLWCATRGAVSTGADDPLRSPAQAAVWGLGRVAAQEHPRRWGGLVDVPESPDRRTAALLHTALCASGGEDQLAVRTAGLRARRLVRTCAPEPAGPAGDPWRPRGTVLITGGTGALGAHTARRLAEHGGPHLHLLLAGRRGPAAPGAAELADELRATGTCVTLAACDTADRAEVQRLLAAVPAEHPLSAVVHTAAALDDAPVGDLDAARIDAAMAVKAGGAHHLHELTAGAGLSAFVLYSSVAGMLGISGQGNYAPANAYLDALARHRRAAGLPATSLAWGAWSGTGMSRRDDVAGLLHRHGMPGMAPQVAAAALEPAFTGGADAAFAVADIDWGRFAPAFTAARPSALLDEVPEARRAAAPPGTPGAGAAPEAGPDPAGALGRRLSEASPPERDRIARTLVREHVAAALGHTAPEAVDEARPFTELGLDSVTAVDLRNRLGAATGLRLPAALAFEHPTVAAVAARLRTELGADGDAADVVAADPSGAEPAADPPAGDAELAALEELLPRLDSERLHESGVAQRLQALARTAARSETPTAADGSLDDATPDEVFAVIDDELGAP